ncbi:3-dehydroquinate synthase [Desulfofalx alkaliphila]|uniref:3-dehydroquinate synthase n=1 Tax=Desulfofalx alkaliphila TaxID=105483 RepID=UPI0004E1B381|nr:3-dehydroquinate synthase [Desulfofalx alkaliphila]
MNTVLPVNLGGRSYDIIIGPGLHQGIGDLLAPLNIGKKVLLVNNPRVGRLYRQTVEQALQQRGYGVTVAEVPDSEEAKSIQQAARLYDVMFDAAMDRNSAVLALGGGVVGDLAGFVAATYMRGVPFVQIPTTLLAMVDSSVGGKVAVNHPQGKNIIGAFYQPKLVLADTDTLASLDKRDVLSGLAEVIKAALIKDADFFNWLEENIHRVLALETQSLQKIIELSCRIKARVVESDETEQGLRAILNYGHTVGHGIETLSGYGIYRHGEAVAMGMVAEARLALQLGLLTEADVERIEKLLENCGLPTAVPKGINARHLLASMYKDKKVLDGLLTFALPDGIGRAVIKRDIPEQLILNTFN